MRTQSATPSSRPRGRSRPLRTARRLAIVVGLLLTISLPAAAQDVVVEGTDGNVWDPDVLEIEAGTTVTFDMVGGGGGHDVAVDGEVVVPFTLIGQSAEYTFEQEGEFDVTCTIHPGMDMVVTVGGGGADPGGDDGAEDEGPVEDDAPGDDGAGEAEGDDAPADEPVEEDAPAQDEAPEADDAPEGDQADDEGAEEVTALAVAGEGDADEGGGDTVLLLAMIVAVALMFGSFAIIRRQD